MKNLLTNITAIIIVAIITLLIWEVEYGTVDYVTVKVTDKERVTQSNSEGGVESKYLVYTESEVFENTDSLFFLKFGSSDVYGRLHKGQTYTFKVNGFRIPMFSSYRNIIKIEE